MLSSKAVPELNTRVLVRQIPGAKRLGPSSGSGGYLCVPPGDAVREFHHVSRAGLVVVFLIDTVPRPSQSTKRFIS